MKAQLSFAVPYGYFFINGFKKNFLYREKQSFWSVCRLLTNIILVRRNNRVDVFHFISPQKGYVS